ncbi:MAG: two-component system, OmpR family, response regulator MtrA [Acidobacteriota bacterium]
MARIIYIEDDDLIADVVKDILTAAGHLIGVVNHGTLGADTVAFKKPDMAIVDLSLPGIGGLKVIEHLRRTSATYMMPILVLTGNRDPAAADEAMGVGANAVMTKPFTPEDLVAKVSEVLRQNPFPSRS